MFFYPMKSTIDLNIETEADLQEIDALLSQHQHSFAGFARQMWAYITVNQLLAERWENNSVKHLCEGKTTNTFVLIC